MEVFSKKKSTKRKARILHCNYYALASFIDWSLANSPWNILDLHASACNTPFTSHLVLLSQHFLHLSAFVRDLLDVFGAKRPGNTRLNSNKD